MRTMGVEEELLLVDPVTGQPASRASDALRADAGAAGARGPDVRRPAQRVTAADGDADRVQTFTGALVGEIQEEQLEIATAPHTDRHRLEEDLRSWRARAAAAASRVGAAVAATATSPLPVHATLTRSPRYVRMAERFRMTADEDLVSGCHVHVAVRSEDEGVGVLDRIRVWLPVVLALSANSPFWQGADTGYASFRSQVWLRWPSAGPGDVLGSGVAYREAVRLMLATGVVLDERMVYLDARLSSRYPTVEVRAADVCLRAEDTVVLAVLCRALVETAAEAWAAGEPPPDVPSWLLRLARWQAGRFGLEGDLLDPATHHPVPAAHVLTALHAHVQPALLTSGEDAYVAAGIARLLDVGTGAARQRAVLRRTGDLAAVVADAVRVTAGEA